MLTFISSIKIDNQSKDSMNNHTCNLVYNGITAYKGNMFCRTCGAVFKFEDEDIDRTKSLPHVTCVKCGKMLQLPSKYLNNTIDALPDVATLPGIQE